MSQSFSTNDFGMRDAPRQKAKPAGTIRIAVLGPSHVMGSGVGDDATFTRLLESRVNAAASPGVRFEVLNFGVAAYSLTKQLAQLDDRVVAFAPDVVVFTDSPRLREPVVQHVAQAVGAGVAIPYPELARTVADTGIAPLASRGIPVPFDSLRSVAHLLGIPTRMPWHEAERRLRYASPRLIRATLDEMKGIAKQHARPLARVRGRIGSAHRRERDDAAAFRRFAPRSFSLEVVFDSFALLRLGERGIEVGIEITAEGGSPRKRPAQPPLVGRELRERCPRHRPQHRVVVGQVNGDPVEPVSDRRAGWAAGLEIWAEHARKHYVRCSRATRTDYV